MGSHRKEFSGVVFLLAVSRFFLSLSLSLTPSLSPDRRKILKPKEKSRHLSTTPPLPSPPPARTPSSLSPSFQGTYKNIYIYVCPLQRTFKYIYIYVLMCIYEGQYLMRPCKAYQGLMWPHGSLVGLIRRHKPRGGNRKFEPTQKYDRS